MNINDILKNEFNLRVCSKLIITIKLIDEGNTIPFYS